jgi:hypothetical protein
MQLQCYNLLQCNNLLHCNMLLQCNIMLQCNSMLQCTKLRSREIHTVLVGRWRQLTGRSARPGRVSRLAGPGFRPPVRGPHRPAGCPSQGSEREVRPGHSRLVGSASEPSASESKAEGLGTVTWRSALLTRKQCQDSASSIAAAASDSDRDHVYTQ